MRTLKKALSLVLVLAMVFALAVPGFAADTTKKASDFKDYSKVTNKEAVDVLTAIGVINGNADGTFAPEGNFTRAEAATMITYLTLGKTVANALPVSATKFSDVPATHWAAKYVQYCADAGIVNGVGNGKFDPDAKLTATQWALMLLGALGYNAKNEGIGGAGWEIATTKLAMKAGVATASELTGTFNRDMAAKFALNTLKANVVEYESNGTNITIGDTTINTGATKAKAVTTTEDYGNNIGKDGVTVGSTTTYTVQFGEQHFSDLKATSTGKTDALGRPATEWTLGKKNEVISTGAAKATLTYTTKVSEKDMAKDLKGYTISVKYTENGTEKTSVSTAEAVAALTGNGKTVEIYVTDSKVTAIAVVAPAFDEVAVKNVAATKTHGAYTVYSVGGVEIGRVYSTVVADNDKTTATVNGTVANKDMVLYYVDKDKNATITAVGTVSGVLSKISSTDVYTIDGTSYKLAAAAKSDMKISKDSQTFYVDADNNLLGTKVGATTTEYALVLKTGEINVLKDTQIIKTYTATIAHADGKVETVNTYETVDADAKTKDCKSLVKEVVTVTTGANGAVLEATDKEVTLTGITKNTSTLATADSSKLYANANTLFVFADYNAKKEVTGTVTTYTGIANVPTVTCTNIFAVDTNNDKIADVVYVYDNALATTTDSYVYVIGTWTQTGTNAYAWDVIKDGKEATITLNDKKGLDAHTLYSKITVNGTVLDAGADKTVKATGGEDKAVVANKGGLLFVKETLVSQKYTDSTPIYVVDTADDTVTTTTFADLTTTVEGTAYVVTDSADANVLAVYVVYSSAK